MNILEMGVFDGKSAIKMARYIKSKSLRINFYLVDRWSEDIDYDRFSKNIVDCNVFDVVIPIRCESIKASIKFNEYYFDFIFIDGDHSYESVKNDIQAWYPKLKVNGIMAGDDYDPCHGGVIKAVDEIFGNSISKEWPVWYIKKEE
jgi:predicted O-methyltransferase YrrM